MKYCDQCTNQSYADEISIPLNEKVIFFFSSTLLMKTVKVMTIPKLIGKKNPRSITTKRLTNEIEIVCPFCCFSFWQST